MHTRQIQLHGGPYDGRVHEQQGWLRPSKIALPDPDGIHIHWYDLTMDGDAVFDKTEKRPGDES